MTIAQQLGIDIGLDDDYNIVDWEKYNRSRIDFGLEPLEPPEPITPVEPPAASPLPSGMRFADIGLDDNYNVVDADRYNQARIDFGLDAAPTTAAATPVRSQPDATPTTQPLTPATDPAAPTAAPTAAPEDDAPYGSGSASYT